jgi:hypothetical protein
MRVWLRVFMYAVACMCGCVAVGDVASGEVDPNSSPKLWRPVSGLSRHAPRCLRAHHPAHLSKLVTCDQAAPIRDQFGSPLD